MPTREVSMDRGSLGLLKGARNIVHWSQEDFAEKSGVSLSTIKKMERRAYSKNDSGDETHGDLFYTTRDVIDAMLGALEEAGITIKKTDTEASLVVDPCRGTGAFFEAAMRVAAGRKDSES